jgi:hypothetical protein
MQTESEVKVIVAVWAHSGILTNRHNYWTRSHNSLDKSIYKPIKNTTLNLVAFKPSNKCSIASPANRGSIDSLITKMISQYGEIQMQEMLMTLTKIHNENARQMNKEKNIERKNIAKKTLRTKPNIPIYGVSYNYGNDKKRANKYYTGNMDILDNILLRPIVRLYSIKTSSGHDYQFRQQSTLYGLETTSQNPRLFPSDIEFDNYTPLTKMVEEISERVKIMFPNSKNIDITFIDNNCTIYSNNGDMVEKHDIFTPDTPGKYIEPTPTPKTASPSNIPLPGNRRCKNRTNKRYGVKHCISKTRK